MFYSKNKQNLTSLRKLNKLFCTSLFSPLYWCVDQCTNLKAWKLHTKCGGFNLKFSTQWERTGVIQVIQDERRSIDECVGMKGHMRRRRVEYLRLKGSEDSSTSRLDAILADRGRQWRAWSAAGARHKRLVRARQLECSEFSSFAC